MSIYLTYFSGGLEDIWVKFSGKIQCEPAMLINGGQ